MDNDGDSGAPPAHPKTYELLSQVWITLRRTHPELAAAADLDSRERRRRAEGR